MLTLSFQLDFKQRLSFVCRIRAIQDELDAIVLRKKIFLTLDKLQAELDSWINWYNHERTREGEYCYGKTQWQSFMERKLLAF
jgi:hypothetical protein